jgi:dihydropyrimidinase
VKTQRSKVDFNVFEGRTVKGQPTHTLSRGVLAYADGDLRATQGHGQYVKRPAFGPNFEAAALRTATQAPTAVRR